MKHEDLPYESRWTSWHTNQTDFRSTPQIDALRLFLWHLWCFLRELDKEACNETLIWPGCICAAGVHTHKYLVSMRMCIPTIRKRQPAEKGRNWNNDARMVLTNNVSHLVEDVSGESDLGAHRRQGATYLQQVQWNNHHFLVFLSSGFRHGGRFNRNSRSVCTWPNTGRLKLCKEWNEKKSVNRGKKESFFFFFYRDLLLVLSLTYDTLFTYLFSWWYPIKNPYLASVTNCLWIGFNKEKPRT